MLDRERTAIGWIDFLWLAFLGGLALLPPVEEVHKQLTLLAIGVEHRATAETAAGAHHMQLHLVGRHAGDLRCDILIEIRHLVTAPDFEHAIFHPRHRIERLERGMGEIREGVSRFEHLRRASERRATSTASPTLTKGGAPGEGAS